MYREVSSSVNKKVTIKEFVLDRPINGFKRLMISVKPYGVDGLSASYFIWGIKEGTLMRKELAWDCGSKTEYCHEKVLNELLKQ